jgi:hypothetical protein
MEKLLNKEMSSLRGGSSNIERTSSSGQIIIYIDGVPHIVTQNRRLIPLSEYKK